MDANLRECSTLSKNSIKTDPVAGALSPPILSLFLAALLISFSPLGYSDVASNMPDFYSEAGFKSTRQDVTENVTENIDPFSGSLHLAYRDLVIHGDGGNDIVIQRHYNSTNVYKGRKTALNFAPNLTKLLARSPYGLGWTIHFGRVIRSRAPLPSTGLTPSICNRNLTSTSDDTLDDPVLELPDGSKQILFVNNTPFDSASSSGAIWITKNRWAAYCFGNSAGLLVISPEGTKYTMNRLAQDPISDFSNYGTRAWYTTLIEDRNGNTITIQYRDSTLDSGSYPLIDRITSSDGRLVTFSYTNLTDKTNVRLSTITSNSQTWRYNYTSLSGYTGHYLLTRVEPPAGGDWVYTYWNKSSGLPGDNILRKATYPYGATVEYDYLYECLNTANGSNCNVTTDIFFSLLVKSKKNGGRDIVANTWNYSYSPGTTEDTTTITFTGGKYIYKHFGSQRILFGSTLFEKDMWTIGLLKEKQIYDGNTLVQRETYTWDKYTISNETYIRPPFDGSHPIYRPLYKDNNVYTPLLTQKVIERDGTSYITTYSNWDAWYNPQTITETGQATKTTTLTYFPRNPGQNIVSLVKDDKLSTINKWNILRTFDSRGNPTVINRYGVPEYFTYYTNGNLNTRKNAFNSTSKRWTYTNYKRGIPRSESHPGGVSISRVVNNTGSIKSETNGRNKTTAYTYDAANRLITINPPRTSSSDISIAWSSTGRTVTRAAYSQVTTFDGFGRPSSINAEGITVDINYDSLGFKSFESYPGSLSGTTFTNDVLGRVTNITHADGTSRSMNYSSGNRVIVTNERGNITTNTYRSYGDPDSQELMTIAAPESVTLSLARNMLGQLESAAQGGKTRSFTYFSTNDFLKTEVNPETGTTVYGRNAVGNMTSIRVGGSSTTSFGYDNLNRMTTINYPTGTPDVSFIYDGNDNVTRVDNGVGRWDYSYGDNDNLTTESLTIDARVLSVTHNYNNLDFHASTIYPNAEPVNFAPNTLGWPTGVGTYATVNNYHPNGMPNTITYGNGDVVTIDINNRQWVSAIRSGTIMDLSYELYDGRGNVGRIADNLDGTNTRIAGYDGLDRLTSISGPWGSGSVSYSATGNINSKNIGGFNLNYSYSASNHRLNSISGSKAYSFAYDTYGNITNNSYNQFNYDDASNQRVTLSADGLTTLASYDYDGNDRRVKRDKAGLITYFFYSRDGQLLGEYGSDNKDKQYYYLGSKLIAETSFVPNLLPTANAGPDLFVNEEQLVALNGSGTDSDGSITSYLWTQTSGPAVLLTNANIANASFSAPRVFADTVFGFQLSVTDNEGATAIDTTQVTVQLVDTDSDGVSDLWELQYFGTLTQSLAVDSDGDGVINSNEYVAGTNPLNGDVNGNGVFNAGDLILVQRHIMGSFTLTPTQQTNADVAPAGGDGTVTIADYVVLQWRLLNTVQ